MRQMLVVICLIGSTISARVVAEERPSRVPPTEESKFFDRVGMVNQNKPITFELGKESLPFVDWAMIDCGRVAWSNAGGVVPLNDQHDAMDEKDILPVPVGVASGVRIRAQKAQKGESYDEFIKPEYPWESGLRYTNTLIYDPSEKLYRLWYYNHGEDVVEYFRDTVYHIPPVAYAESKDLKNWHKPLVSPTSYGSHQKTNMIYLTNEAESEEWLIQKNGKGVRPGYGGAFFIDPSASDIERFKTTFNTSSDRKQLEAFARRAGKPLSPMVSEGQANAIYGAVSPDGIGWRILKNPILLHDADCQTVVHYDELLKRYEMFTRLFEFGRRTIARSESTEFADFPLPYTVIGTGPREAPYVDHYHIGVTRYPGNPDIRLGTINVYNRSLDKSTVRLAVSRNGHFWDWVPGDPIIDPDDLQDWGLSYVAVAPHLVRTPDKRMMVTYAGTVLPHKFPRHQHQSRLSGVAWWKEDRMVALEAPGRGEFTTAYMHLAGNQILLNMKTERAGQVQVQVLDDKFQPVPGRTFAEADLLIGDSLAMPVAWKGDSDLSQHRDQLIYLQFRMRAAKLYALKAFD